MLKTVLPPNATALEVALDTNNARRFEGLMTATSESSKTWSAADCPAPLLPFLAWALSVDTWNTDWSEKVKRQVIASAVFVHRHKGTRAGIDMALKSLDLGVSISEWFEHNGAPYTFQIDVITQHGLSKSDIDIIHQSVRNTKNARSWLSRLRIHLCAKTKINQSCAAVYGRTIRLPVYVPAVPAQTLTPRPSFTMSSHRRITIGAPA